MSYNFQTGKFQATKFYVNELGGAENVERLPVCRGVARVALASLTYVCDFEKSPPELRLIV